MKKYFQIIEILALCLILSSCSNAQKSTNGAINEFKADSKFSVGLNQLLKTGSENPFSISLTPVKTDYYLPALHSYASATYNGMWIFIGGEVAGFHGTSNNPPPFMKTVANDSLWVIDPANGKSYGAPVPEQYRNSLSATNPQSFQVGNDFYICGGYTVSDATKTRFNTTSDYFFRIDIPNLIQYVQSGGSAPALNMVFPVALENDFVRVTGGELFVENNNFYLIGGQDFEGAYSAGTTGTYTNAIRSFTLQQNGQSWSLANMNTLVDSVNLHRRDFNLVPYVASDGTLDAIILGGVFTSKDLSYNNPVYISGLSTGKPTIASGTFQQTCNQYSCAIVPVYVSPGSAMLYSLLGGISYMKYSSESGGLVVGDEAPMPFSNLADFIVSDSDSTVEYVQVPPHPLLPGYLGSNASFMPLPHFVSNEYENVLDLTKILANNSDNVNIGYMFGGILSNGPTAGTTLKGHVNTYANSVLYSVNLSIDLNKLKTARNN